MTRQTHLAIVLLAASLVVGGGVVVTIGGTGALAQQEAEATVTMEDQVSDGETVIVDEVTLPDDGYVVIHDESLQDGDAVGSVVGVSVHLEAGTHEDVPVTVAPNFDSVDGINVTAMAHRDTNDNQVFDFVTSNASLDGPYTAVVANETDPDNETTTEPVVDEAVVNASGTQVPATNLEFQNQTSDGTNLTIQRVTLYRGGYVVIHDSMLQEEGDAIGSVIGHSGYLAPGTYEDVNVTLARPLELDEETNASVTAMPHFDTNGNLVFDFVTSEADEDGPYVDENGSAVIQNATITAEATPETPTETEAPPTTTENETETEGPPTTAENETETEEPTTTEETEEPTTTESPPTGNETTTEAGESG